MSSFAEAKHDLLTAVCKHLADGDDYRPAFEACLEAWRAEAPNELVVPPFLGLLSRALTAGPEREALASLRTKASEEDVGLLVRSVINDVEAVQMTGEEDVREEWPDLWETYELACKIAGVDPKTEPDDGYSFEV